MGTKSSLIIDHATVAAIFSLQITCVVTGYTIARVWKTNITMLARATLSQQGINKELSFAAARAHATNA